ncbi:S-layer homology domain-containing protein [Paenibacillus amylolyticus]|uniref:S-layer homology domain-containing protein n=1 Tax=Paenibacillus amylolyticus TaxID=1451 RepID=UPI003EBE89D2
MVFSESTTGEKYSTIRRMAHLFLAMILLIPSLIVGGDKTLAAASGWSIIDGGGANGLNVNQAMAAETPAIVEWNGEIYVAWSERIQTTPAIHQIRVKKFNGSGWVSIDGNQPVYGLNADINRDVGNPDLAVYNNALYLTWMEKNASYKDQVRVKKYDGTMWTNAEGGSTIGINVNPAANALGPKLTAYKGELYAMWTEDGKMRAKKYNDTTWTSIDGGGAGGMNINPSSYSGPPAMIVMGDDLYATWYEMTTGPNYKLRVLRYDGLNWSVADGGVGLNRSAAKLPINPSLAVMNDILYLGWTEPIDRTDEQVYVKKFESGIWSSIDGDGNNGISVAPGARSNTIKLVTLNNELYAVWSENSFTTVNTVPIFKIRVKKYDGNGWKLAESGRNGGLNTSTSRTAVTPSVVPMNGALYAVWSENDRSVTNVRAAGYIPPPPPSVNGVTVSPITTSMQQGVNRQLTAVVDAVGEAATTVTWSSSDATNKVTVDSGGVVRVARDAVPGDYLITATSTYDNSKKGTATVTVTYAPAVSSVTVNPSTASLLQGESTQLTASVASVGGARTTVTWSSSDTNNKVTVNGTGKVSVAANTPPGDYTITATSTFDTSKKGSAVITVAYAPAVTSIIVTPDNDSMMQGESRQLAATVHAVGGAATTVTWVSSDADNKVAVSNTGLVTAAPDAVPGLYSITAISTADSSKSATATITVTYAPAVNGVTVTPDPASIVQGDSLQLGASVDVVGGASTEVTWSSSDLNGKVLVSNTGNVTVASDAMPGNYIITATSVEDNSKAGTSTVTVTYAPAVQGISIQPDSARVVQGRGKQLAATVTAVGGADETVNWTSSDSSGKVTVSNAGYVSVAVDAEPGDYTITATSVFDASKTAAATIKVTYVPAVNRVVVTPVTASLMQGESRHLAATVDIVGDADNSVMWSSNDTTNKVGVDDTGYVTVATDAEPGEYIISATSTEDSSKKGTMILTVTAAPTYTIAGIADQTLQSVLLGYNSGSQEMITVPVQHTGTGKLVNLSVSLSGNDLDAFTITQPMVELEAGDKTSFNVHAKDGLSAGTYTAKVTLTADHMLPVTFNITQAVNLPNAPANPRHLTAESGERKVTLKWDMEPDVTQYRIYMATDADPNHRVEVTANASSPYTIPDLVNGTAYYFVVKAENVGGLSEASNLVSAIPSDMPGVPTDVTATPGDGQAVLKFTAPTDDGGSPITGYEVTVSPGDRKVTGNASPITITGLRNGTSYTFTVKAMNGAGKSAESAPSNAVVPLATSVPSNNSPGTPPTATAPGPSTTPVQPATTGVDILVNGKVENAGQATVTKRDQQTALTIVVDQKKLNDRLAEEGRNAVVTIPINRSYDIFVGELTGEMIRTMEEYEAVLEFKTDQASYMVPASQIRIAELADQVGGAADLQALKVHVEIASPTAAEQNIVERATAQNELTLVAPPLNFVVNASYGENSVEIKKFDAYVERSIVIPDGIDPNKITTGVVVEPDGSVRHVPTKVRKNNGRYEAQINSLTNSTYAVVWHPLEFSDVVHHWGKNAVNDMGSRMIVEGFSNGTFNPDQAVTRAEFATMVIRGLGLRVESRDTAFSDVQSGHWYSGTIHTAHAYGLINGFDDGTFRPDDTITREQAMVILEKAMQITGLRVKLNNESPESTLQGFGDVTAVSPWARSGAVDSVKAGLVQGRSQSLLVPKGKMTRAEVATMLQRLLQKSNLI